MFTKFTTEPRWYDADGGIVKPAITCPVLQNPVSKDDVFESDGVTAKQVTLAKRCDYAAHAAYAQNATYAQNAKNVSSGGIAQNTAAIQLKNIESMQTIKLGSGLVIAGPKVEDPFDSSLIFTSFRCDIHPAFSPSTVPLVLYDNFSCFSMPQREYTEGYKKIRKFLFSSLFREGHKDIWKCDFLFTTGSTNTSIEISFNEFCITNISNTTSQYFQKSIIYKKNGYTYDKEGLVNGTIDVNLLSMRYISFINV